MAGSRFWSTTWAEVLAAYASPTVPMRIGAARWTATFQTVCTMRLALPHMKGGPGAAVINIASISGWSPQVAMSGQYGAAKAALIFDTGRWSSGHTASV